MRVVAAAIVLAVAAGGSTPATTPATGPASDPCEHRPVPVAAVQSGERHAGLIVESPSGTRQFCIAFSAQEEAAGFSGVDLLQRAEHDLASVCRIGDDGCGDPGDCFCQCHDTGAASCRFWGYYTLGEQGAWSFAQQSPSLRRIRDGDVDGWRFGAHAGGAGEPPAVPEARCANVAVARTAGGPARRGGGVPLGVIAASVVALGFAVGIAYGVRRRPGGST
ncbi:MAG TPA: hypothetical protein VM841_02645 [Actinomycetota bacterium]|nr:hypothetical protein [Actinomycetota bacterium]